MTIADLVTGVFGDDLPIGFEAYDGTRWVRPTPTPR